MPILVLSMSIIQIEPNKFLDINRKESIKYLQKTNTKSINDLIITCIIPTRCNRPYFLNFCFEQLENQTRKVNNILLIDEKPINKNIKDITYRYRIGLQKALKFNSDLIFFIEDDDFYHPNYIEFICNKWLENNQPLLFGIEETFYYHIKINKYSHMLHPRRASAFNTCLSPLLIKEIKFPKDDESFFDLVLWNQFTLDKKKTIKWDLNKTYSIGIKHGLSIVGGNSHDASKWNKNLIDREEWFKNIVGNNYYNFYKQISNF